MTFDDLNHKSVNINNWGVGVISLYLNLDIVSDIYTCDFGNDKPIIYTGQLVKGIRSKLSAMFPKGWVVAVSGNSVCDIILTEKSQIIDFCNNYIEIPVRTKDSLSNFDWSEVCRVLKEGFYLGKIKSSSVDNVFKFYESLIMKKQDRLEHYFNMSMPDRLMESVLLTFIRKAKDYEIIQTNSKKYKLLLKEFHDKNPNIDMLLIQYATKKMDTKDKLLWFMGSIA